MSSLGESTPSCSAIRFKSQDAVTPLWMITSSAASYSASGSESSSRRASVVFPAPMSPTRMPRPFICAQMCVSRTSACECCGELK